MNESFNQDELSVDDLAILQAFENLDLSDWEGASPSPETLSPEADTSVVGSNGTPANGQFSSSLPGSHTHNSSPTSQEDALSPADIFALYLGEVDEDMSTIRHALQQLEPDEQLDAARLQTIQRLAHKMKGTSAAIGYTTIATLAHHVEELIRLITTGIVIPFIGLHALAQTVHTLEMTVNSLVTSGQENTAPLVELEAEYKALNIGIYNNSRSPYPSSAPAQAGTSVRIPFNLSAEDESQLPAGATRPLQELASSTPFVRVDVRRFEQLILFSEQLAELSAPLEHAQAEVARAMQELHAAQARLQHLETSLSSHLTFNKSNPGQSYLDEQPTSSLVARILDESAQRTGHSYQRKNRLQYQRPLVSEQSLYQDALAIDRFTEADVLAHSLSEAIADVATASSQLRMAFDRLQLITHKHIAQANSVRNHTSLLRLTPMGPLLTCIERAVTISSIAQQRQIQFEVAGETTEIDQDILAELKKPLLQLVRTCVAHDLAPAQESSVDRIWFFVHAVGNEITIEIGFSQPIGAGSLNEVQEAIRRLNGSITAQKNDTGSISFYLRLPRSQGAVLGLLVRAGHQHIILPFSQVQRIDERQQHAGQSLVTLNTLLGLPAAAPSEAVQPVLILQPALYPSHLPHPLHSLTVQVDEVLGTVELVVKPLPSHLQRPGITGTAIDGTGNVLLMVDMPELVRHQQLLLSQP